MDLPNFAAPQRKRSLPQFGQRASILRRDVYEILSFDKGRVRAGASHDSGRYIKTTNFERGRWIRTTTRDYIEVRNS